MPPHDRSAEAKLLGAMLLHEAAAFEGVASLTAGDFYWPTHANVFSAMEQLVMRGERVSVHSVEAQLRIEGLLDGLTLHNSQGAAVLITLLSSGDTPVEHYVAIIKRYAAARAVVAKAERLSEAGYAADLEAAAGILAEGTDLAVGPSGFQRIDLTPLMVDGSPPSLVHPWLYSGGLTVIQSDPGVGKTWLATSLAHDVMSSGHSIVYLDEEGGPELVAERFAAVGADPALLAERLFYFAFEARSWNAADLAALDEVIVQASAVADGLGLAVLDSLPDFLAAADLSEDSAGDVTKFIRLVCSRFRAAGAAQVVLDHLTKPQTDGKRRRGRFSRGSGAKLAKADATILIETGQPFDRFTSGQLHLWKAKDRRGYLGLPDIAGAPLRVDVVVSEGKLTLVESGLAEATPWDGPTRCMEAVQELLAATAPTEYSGRQLAKAVCVAGQGFRESTVREAAERLALDGVVRVRTGARRARLYRWSSGQVEAQEEFEHDQF